MARTLILTELLDITLACAMQMREGDMYNLLKGFGSVLSSVALALETFTEVEDGQAVPAVHGSGGGGTSAVQAGTMQPGPTNAVVAAFFRQLSSAFAEKFQEFKA